MEINVTTTNFFGNNPNILKYCTIWDKIFARDGLKFKFYPRNPAYVVDVEIYADKDKLTKKDVGIICGLLHNAKNVPDFIEKNEEEIFEVCKNAVELEFLLDLSNMSIVTYDDFTKDMPVCGLNTLFITNENKLINTLVNANPNVFTDGQYLAWLLTYIQSSKASTMPYNKIESDAKLFLQTLCCTGVKGTEVIAHSSILSAPMGDSGNLLMEVFGKKERLLLMRDKSIDEIRKNRLKLEKKLALERKGAK